MMRNQALWAARGLIAASALASNAVLAEFEQELEWEFSVQARAFGQSAAYPQQSDFDASIAIQPEWLMEWQRGDYSVVISPFVRLDSNDDERSHFDLREAYWQGIFDRLELRLGISKVFWGKTELLHLVDTINQVDQVENIDGEDRLGQPMLRLAYSQGPVQMHAYALPYFRERSFAGADGRLRPPLVVDTDNPIYQSSDEEQHWDYALRVQGYWDALDYGLAWFKGTNRNPQLIPGGFVATPQGVVPTSLRAFYGQTEQLSLDAQYTWNSWLFKLEAVQRDEAVLQGTPGQAAQIVQDDYAAATGGFEFTQYGILDSPLDIGYLIEYLWDERGDSSSSGFQNDLFLAARLAANDTAGSALLAGIVVDLDKGSQFVSFEASRRLSGSSKLELQLRLFGNVAQDDPVFLPVSRDDYLQIEYIHYL